MRYFIITTTLVLTLGCAANNAHPTAWRQMTPEQARQYDRWRHNQEVQAQLTVDKTADRAIRRHYIKRLCATKLLECRQEASQEDCAECSAECKTIEHWPAICPYERRAAPTQPALIFAGSVDGDAVQSYVMDHPERARLRRANTYATTKGYIRTHPGCTTVGPIFWARTGTVRRTTKWNESPDGRVPAGARYLHVRLDKGLCLSATRQREPTGLNEWWIDGGTGKITQMTAGGGPSQCVGKCPWYTRVNRTVRPRIRIKRATDRF